MLEEKLPQNLYYHGVHHTEGVLKAVKELAVLECVNEEQNKLLQYAALFHDTGFLYQYKDNEEKAVDFLRQTLLDYQIDENFIEVVGSIILATQLEYKPVNLLEQIMCDADFDYFGRDDFHSISETLRNELNENGYSYSESEWDKIQIAFLEKHQYYTAAAKKTRLPKKLDNLAEIKSRLAVY